MRTRASTGFGGSCRDAQITETDVRVRSYFYSPALALNALHCAARPPARSGVGGHVDTRIHRGRREIPSTHRFPTTLRIINWLRTTTHNGSLSTQHATTRAQPRKNADVPVGANAALRRAEPSPSARVDIMVVVALVAVWVRCSLATTGRGSRRRARRRAISNSAPCNPGAG